jgi:hypothetical protein
MVSPGDEELKALRHRDEFMAAAASSDTAMVDGNRPIGDAWIHTKPTFAFGASLALTHAFSLAELLDEHHDPAVASEAFDAAHAADAGQRWAAVTAEDRDHTRSWTGERIDPLDPASSMPLFPRSVVYAAADHDPDILRRVARCIDALDPLDALEQDDTLLDRARKIHQTLSANGELLSARAPDRDELVGTMKAASRTVTNHHARHVVGG